MMTAEEHRARHVVLHQALDELLADYLRVVCSYPNYHGPSDITVFELAKWSQQQTIEPTDDGGRV
jgi:hypothetical protein